MKVNVNQKLTGIDGIEELRGDKGLPMLLKDVCIQSLLTPNQQDDEKKKWDKYEIFKKLRDALPKDGEIIIELKVEEISILKAAIGRAQTPLLMGQCWEMIEDNKLKTVKR